MNSFIRVGVCLILTCALFGCGAASNQGSGNNDDDNDAEQEEVPTVQPILTHLPLSIEAYDAATGMAGDIDFNFPTIDSTGKVFLEFQGVIQEASDSQDEQRLPHFTFNVPEGTPVYSMLAGTVTAVEVNDNSPDTEIRIRSADAPDFTSTYDHLQNVTVEVGDTVSGGEQLGEAAHNKVEADIADFSTSPNTAYCPNTFFSDAVAAQHIATLAQLMEDWETVQEDEGLYDEESMFATGCVSATGQL